MPFFPLADVEASFRKIALHVASPLVAYVLGGAAMAKLGVKAATKDVDLVFRNRGDVEAFEAALVAVGAQRLHEPGGRAERPGARRVWETADGMGWDLFLGNVVGFRLLEADYESSVPWLAEKNLEVRRLAPDLVFVMKAVTPRTRDIGDMADLLSSGAATAAGVERLVAERIPLTPDQAWLSRFYRGVKDMSDERGIDVRWVERFEGEATAEAEGALIGGWLAEKPLTLAELAKRLRASSKETRAVLERLEALGKVRRNGDRWSGVPTNV